MAGLTQTKPTETRSRRTRVTSRLIAVLGGVAGFVLAVIAILNLHILVGLEQGYAATPAQVVEFSIVLAVVDVIILVVGPVLGALAMRWMTRITSTSDPTLL
jgi:hypothetical protein